jgi:phosphatidylglycerophosphate synthase
MGESEFNESKRQQESLLSGLERRALIWLAERMPRRIHSDHLTLIGFGAMILAGLSYFLTRFSPEWLWAGSACLVVNWFGDSLDGTLARQRNQERPRYGFYVDHVTDAVGTFCLLGGLALSDYMTETMALLLLVTYFLLSIDSYLATYVLGTFRLSFWKLSPTELRILLIVGNVALLYHPQVGLFGRQWLLFDFGALIGCVLMSGMFVASAIRNASTLWNMEPLARPRWDRAPRSD